MPAPESSWRYRWESIREFVMEPIDALWQAREDRRLDSTGSALGPAAQRAAAELKDTIGSRLVLKRGRAVLSRGGSSPRQGVIRIR